jgi:hypothetical protein
MCTKPEIQRDQIISIINAGNPIAAISPRTPECVIELTIFTLGLHGFSNADGKGDVLMRSSNTWFIVFVAGISKS